MNADWQTDSLEEFSGKINKMPPMKKQSSRRQKKQTAYKKKRSSNQPEWASMSETVDYKNTVFTVGNYYNFVDIQLAQFTRASTVAQGYQFYRIKKIAFTFQPLLDTFTAGGTTQVPYLHWVINKTGNTFPGLNKDWFLANGAKPIRFDDKNVTIAYAPAAMIDTIEAGVVGAQNQPNMPKVSPWLTTNRDAYAGVWNPSQASHAGHHLLVTSEGSADPMTFRVQATVEFQFKKPMSRLPLAEDVGYSVAVIPRP